MSDERVVEELSQAVTRIDRDYEDFKSTILARVSRKPTGDIEQTLRSTPKADTLLLQGQVVSRAIYPGLWSWVQEQGLVGSGFTAGDGSTTFGLPDLRGRVLVGAGVGDGQTYALGAAGGAALRAISIANLPAHDHNVSGSTNSQSHNHGGSTGGGGSHPGHFNGSPAGAAAGGAFNAALFDSGGTVRGDHSHGFTTDTDSHSHTLTINESTVGSGTPYDVRQPFFVGNYLIWT